MTLMMVGFILSQGFSLTLKPGDDGSSKEVLDQLGNTPWWSEIPFSEIKSEPIETGGTSICFLDQSKRMIPHKGRQVTIVCSSGTQFVLQSMDSTGEGFENNESVEPVAGNPGLTLGEQRFNAVAQSLSILGDYINSSVPIVVEVEAPDNVGGFLAQCGPSYMLSSFTNAPQMNVYYSVAEANSFAGFDLYPDSSDIHAKFYFDENWNYRLDSDTLVQGGIYSTLVIAMHEFSHGLGFLSLSGPSGTLPYDTPGIYSHFLKDLTTNKHWNLMTNEERAASALNTGNLVWDGSRVRSLLGGYHGGVKSGCALIFNPNPYRPGSSISHFDTSFSPDELMEYAYNRAYKIDLTLALLDDIGWSTNVVENEPVFVPSDPSNLRAVFVTESVIQIGWVDEAVTEDEYHVKADSYYHVLPANASSFHLEDLDPNTRHSFTVVPWNGRSGTVPPNPIVVYTKPNVPDVPIKGASTTSTVELTLDVGDNPAGTEIGIYCNNTSQWVQADFTLGDTKFFKPYWRTITVSELMDNTAYEFVAIARNADELETLSSQKVRVYTNPIPEKGNWFLCY